jgi:DNA-binding GntR family transcriptional regulator
MELALPLDGQRRTAHEVVRESLRRAILTGALPGGTRLVQADIAAQLQVSTTPVREALRDLATEGLIRLDPHRGAIVYEPDLQEVRDLYDIRQILEVEAIKRAVSAITEEELARAEAIQARMDQETDPVLWVDLNRDFHAALADAARSSRLSALLKNLRDAAAVYVALSLESGDDQLAAGNEDHHRLLDAMRRKDAETAASMVVHHLESTMDAVEQGQRRRQAGQAAAG